jgi:transposase
VCIFDNGLTQRLIARCLSVDRFIVERAPKRFAAVGLTWPINLDLTDEELERRLYRGTTHQGAAKSCVRPNYAELSKQRGRKGVTSRVLWTE